MAKAALEQAMAEAKGKEALVEAKNKANVNNILMELVGVMPEITKELMAPAGKISDVKIFSMNGGDSSGGLGKTILDSGMLMPLLEEISSGKNIKDLIETFTNKTSSDKEKVEPSEHKHVPARMQHQPHHVVEHPDNQ